MGRETENVRTVVSLLLLVLPLTSLVSADDAEFTCPPPTTRSPSCSCTSQDRTIICTSVNWTGSIPSDFPRSLKALTVHLKDSIGSVDALREPLDYTQLTQLHLNAVGLRHISPGVFRQLGLLETLTLADNLLRVVEKGTFDGLNRLQLLDLAGNPLYLIDVDFFAGSTPILPALLTLDLSRCRLNDIAPGALSGLLDHLVELLVADNRLESLPDFAGHSLRVLDATSNRIRSLEGAVISPTVDKLNLTGNHIERLTSASTLRCHLTNKAPNTCQLTELVLRGNRLSEIGYGCFSSLPKLERLDVAFNALTGIDADALPWDTLQEVFVHDNPWDCSGCRNAWLLEKAESVTKFNDDYSVTCASPSSLAGKSINDDNDDEVFTSCSGNSRPSRPKVTFAVIGCLLVLVGVIALVGYLVRRRRRSMLAGRRLVPRGSWQPIKVGGGTSTGDGVGQTVAYRQMFDTPANK